MNYPFPKTVVNPALGSDLAGVSDLTAQMAEVSGRRCFAEGLARRLITPRGDLLDDPDYGTDVTEMLNDDIDAAAIPRIAASIEAEWLKDERCLAATVVVVVTPALGFAVALTITGTVTDGRGTFRLVLAATSVTVALLEVTPS